MGGLELFVHIVSCQSKLSILKDVEDSVLRDG